MASLKKVENLPIVWLYNIKMKYQFVFYFKGEKIGYDHTLNKAKPNSKSANNLK